MTIELTPERALAFLRERDVDLQEFVSNPKVFDASCKMVYLLLPPPVRWALKEKGVRRILGAARDLYLAHGDVDASSESTPLSLARRCSSIWRAGMKTSASTPSVSS